MEHLESRTLLSIALTILTDPEGFSIGAIVTSDEEPDTIWVQYNWALDQVVINPDRENLLLDQSIRTVIVDAGDGDDVVQVRGGGGAIQYTVDGGPGNDTITGSNGHDWLEGGEGDDWISGALGADYLAGGPGNDTLAGGNGGDLLIGGDGADELWGGRGFDQLVADTQDIVTLGEALSYPEATPPDVVIDPNEVVTPPCPPECPPGWDHF